MTKHTVESNEKKHEDVLEELKNEMLIGAIFDESHKKELVSILSKHYDTPVEPELVAGMWVSDSKVPNKLFFIKDCNKDKRFLNALWLDGSSCGLQYKLCKPHTFVETDLELLNTSEVKYTLHPDQHGYLVRNTILSINSYSDSHSYKTIHEAILEIFNAVLGENLRKGLIK